MIYKFICPKCGKKQDLVMRITKYKSTGHTCPDCGTEMVRDPEGFSCNFIVKCDGFFGKSGQK